jgi:hypothetical protein
MTNTRLDGKQVTIPCCNIFRQATVGFTTSGEEAA